MNINEFDPALEAVAKIRQLSIGLSNDWSQMKMIGGELIEQMELLTKQVHVYASEDTNKSWDELIAEYVNEVKGLRQLMAEVNDQIKQKNAVGLSSKWESHKVHSEKIAEIYEQLKNKGSAVLPENQRVQWETIWEKIEGLHAEINRVADACFVQTQLIEQIAPEELDNLTDQILKHIPRHYSVEKSQKYEQDYRKAFEELKKEASQKKTLWDKFLDVLAGGVKQTAAERVMLQRWVDGEKGDL